MTTRDKWQLMVKTQSTREIYSLENEALCIWVHQLVNRGTRTTLEIIRTRFSFSDVSYSRYI